MKEKKKINSRNFPQPNLFIIKDFKLTFEIISFWNFVWKQLSLQEMTAMKDSTSDGRIWSFVLFCLACFIFLLGKKKKSIVNPVTILPNIFWILQVREIYIWMFFWNELIMVLSYHFNISHGLHWRATSELGSFSHQMIFCGLDERGVLWVVLWNIILDYLLRYQIIYPF